MRIDYFHASNKEQAEQLIAQEKRQPEFVSASMWPWSLESSKFVVELKRKGFHDDAAEDFGADAR